MKGYRNGVYMGKTIKKGEHLSVATQFGKGNVPWNKGLKKRLNTGRTHFKKGHGFWTGKKRPNMMGVNHPNWNGGTCNEPYIYGWKQIKDVIRVRDNHTCQECGVPETECVRRLCVHHIDYNKKNCSHNNLISLCLLCHIKTNKNRDMWTKYFKEKLDAIRVA